MSEETKTVQASEKTPMNIKLGYGFGIWGDSLGNNLFYAFYSYFMTNIAMVLPITVGIISLLGVVWDAITDPIVALINAKRPLTKQASLIMVGTIPYVIALVMTFTIPGSLSGAALSVYYIVAALIMFLGYTMYCIPYYSLLPQLTSDYTERINITSVRSYFNTFACLAASVLPPVMVGWFAPAAGSEAGGWFITVVILAVFVLLSGIAATKSIISAIKNRKGDEASEVKEEDPRRSKNIFVEFTKGLSVKTNRRALIAICLFMISSAMHRTGGAYWITTACGFPLTVVSLVSLVGLCSWFVLIPIGQKIVQKYDIRRCILIFLGIGVVGRVLFFFIGAKNVPMAIVYYLIAAFSDVACYTFMYSLGPDGFLLDELKFGYDRTPVVHSVSTFGLKIANALGLFVWTGIILTTSGYDATLDAQAGGTVSSIHFWFTLGIAILAAISWILYYLYPITRQKYDELLAAVQQLRETGDYDHSVTDGLF